MSGLVIVGCASSGLSSREAGRRSQANYLSAMQVDESTNLGPRRPFIAPARLAVAQVGEVAPPAVMVERLRDASALFRHVDAIPAIASDQVAYRYGQTDDVTRTRDEVAALRRLAASTGADYLLLVGGSVDQASNPTGLSVLNLTIIGAFIVPSRETSALMKASAAMIDVQTGRVVSISNAELQKDQLTPSISTTGQNVRMLKRMRDEVTLDLANRVIDDCRAELGNASAARLDR